MHTVSSKREMYIFWLNREEEEEKEMSKGLSRTYKQYRTIYNLNVCLKLNSEQSEGGGTGLEVLRK